MKRLTAVALVAFLSVSPVQAGLWDSIANSGLKEVTPTANYELSVYGFDARVYEWTPEYNQNISCVFVSSNKSSGTACYPKAEK